MDHLCVELIQKVEYKAKREDGGVFWETKCSRDEVAQVKSRYLLCLLCNWKNNKE